MKTQKLNIGTIPAIIWGEESDKAYIYVHGKMSNKESAEQFALIAQSKGFQTLSFDLPEHGERSGTEYRCNIWNGVRDLTGVSGYVFSHWRTVSLFACSLGAFFSLHAYGGTKFGNCLFQSPIVDMEYLIKQMFSWFSVTEAQLKERKEIETPVDTLSWDYYTYVREHPVSVWQSPTAILYAGRDNLQSRSVIDGFARRFQCRVTVAEHCEHPFMGIHDGAIVQDWLKRTV